jgi:hypothetical protein
MCTKLNDGQAHLARLRPNNFCDSFRKNVHIESLQQNVERGKRRKREYGYAIVGVDISLRNFLR